MPPTPAAAAFRPQTRFNWGFYDAAQCVERGWATVVHNYGFAPSLTVTCPSDVERHHPDYYYARGWLAGYDAAKAGQDTASSAPAWERDEDQRDALRAAGVR